jgi:hypothetical protein
MSDLELTVITLALATDPEEARDFAEAMWKFHQRCQFRGQMRHIIVDASANELKRLFKRHLIGLPEIAGLEIHDGLGSWARDFNLAFGLVRTKYVLFFLPDHILEVQSDDFLSECAAALERHPDIYQIHLGGPYAEWSVEPKLLNDEGFRAYVLEHNPFRVPFYPWFRIDEDHLWYGGRLLYSKGIPSPGNPLERRVIRTNSSSLWVSAPNPLGEPIRTQASFIAGGGAKHLALGFNGAPCFYNFERFREYLPLPEDLSGKPAELGELYFYRKTDIDQKYATAWLNAQSFFWHRDYGWSLTNESDRALFREVMMRKEL